MLFRSQRPEAAAVATYELWNNVMHTLHLSWLINCTLSSLLDKTILGQLSMHLPHLLHISASTLSLCENDSLLKILDICQVDGVVDTLRFFCVIHFAANFPKHSTIFYNAHSSLV